MIPMHSVRSSRTTASSRSSPENPIAKKGFATTRKPKGRNVVERCFCRLKDFRRIVTRYDKLARNFFSALCFVATLAYWL
jgi:transposase